MPLLRQVLFFELKDGHATKILLPVALPLLAITTAYQIQLFSVIKFLSELPKTLKFGRHILQL